MKLEYVLAKKDKWFWIKIMTVQQGERKSFLPRKPGMWTRRMLAFVKYKLASYDWDEVVGDGPDELVRFPHHEEPLLPF